MAVGREMQDVYFKRETKTKSTSLITIILYTYVHILHVIIRNLTDYGFFLYCWVCFSCTHCVVAQEKIWLSATLRYRYMIKYLGKTAKRQT